MREKCLVKCGRIIEQSSMCVYVILCNISINLITQITNLFYNVIVTFEKKYLFRSLQFFYMITIHIMRIKESVFVYEFTKYY